MKLYDIIIKKKQEVAPYSDNLTLDAIDANYCKVIDESTSPFVQDRGEKCKRILESINKIDYDSMFKSAYEAYNEAITFSDLSRICDIVNIPETDESTPDFKVEFKRDGNEKLDIIYMELKTIAFSDGNLNYLRSQESALKARIKSEDEIKKGRKCVITERIIDPFGNNRKSNPSGSGFEEQFDIEYSSFKDDIRIIRDKIKNNFKESQFTNGDTIMIVDLNQLGFNVRNEDCVAVERSFNHVGYTSGLLWNVAFGKEGDRLFLMPQFEGMPNLDDTTLGFNGILVDYDIIKGLLFISGRTPEERSLFGFYKYKDQDSSVAHFINLVSTFYNDDRNSYGFNVNKERCALKDTKRILSK